MIYIVSALAALALIALISGVWGIKINHKRAEQRKAAAIALNGWIDLAESIESREAAEANRNFEWRG